MKTQFYSYIQYTGVLLCSMLLLFSCSKNSDTEPEPNPTEKMDLVLTASATDITVQQKVTFETTAGGKVIDADIYINNSKINGITHSFEAADTYTAVAKKEGYTDSKEIEITVKAEPKKVAKITVKKINTATYRPAYGDGHSRMAMSEHHVYTYSRTTDKFMRYDLKNDTWENLNHTSQLAFSGRRGRMVYLKNGDLICIIGKEVGAYFHPNHAFRRFQNTWAEENIILEKFRKSKSAIAVMDKYIYFAGNSYRNENGRRIDRYNTSNNTWEALAKLPQSFDAASTSTFYDKKMYILGSSATSTGFGPAKMYVFDTEKFTVTDLPVHESINDSRTWPYAQIESQQNFIGFDGYLLYYAENKAYVFDIEESQWLEDPVETGDILQRYNYLMSPTPNKLYAAGTKDGNFVLYEMELSVTEE